MNLVPDVTVETFNAINHLNFNVIKNLSENQLRPILPCLTRMAFCTSLDQSEEWSTRKKEILKIISHMEEVNMIVSLLSVDFQSIDHEIRKNLPNEEKKLTPIDFECGTPTRKLMLFFSEFAMLQNTCKKNKPINKFIQSELFDHELFVDIVSDIICIVLAELPNNIQLVELIETLTYVKIGSKLICRIAANFTEYFNDICLSLLNMSDDNLSDDNFMGFNRINIIRQLCKMNPSYSLIIRSAAIENFKMPALCVYLTLDHINNNYENNIENLKIDNPNNINEFENLDHLNELVSFLEGILLGYDEVTKNWFAQYLKNDQKKIEIFKVQSSTAIVLLREHLLKYLNYLLNLSNVETEDKNFESTKLIIQCTALLKLYCAFFNLTSIKHNDKEKFGLLNLITIRTPSTSAGIRFASIGICTLLTFPTLLASFETERKVVSWLQYIVDKFGQRSGVGEMLLLIAIHFHGNQNNAISELVSKFLGMRIPFRHANLVKIKQIFTNEIFTEKVVTSHAIQVPVTKNLNSLMTGFLPVHCIFQLLKSRAFSKYKVPIKDWIFEQICNSTAPLNPVLPSLIEIYVNSIIVPSSTKNIYTNESISEEELNKIFDFKIYCIETEILDDYNKILTTQILLSYYVLFYNDARLNQLKTPYLLDKSIKKYSSHLMSKIPFFYLLQEAKFNQDKYGQIFPSLLKLISTYYSHLCLVPDWFSSNEFTQEFTNNDKFLKKININSEKKRLLNALDMIKDTDHFVKTFDHLLQLPRNVIWPLAELFIEKLNIFLEPTIDTIVLTKAKDFWWKLNSVFPDALRVMTVNSLTNFKLQKLTWEDISKDPLQVLKCNKSLFNCPEFMEIILHILQSFLIASRTFFAHHLLEMHSKNELSTLTNKDTEELRLALIQAQESCAIQILLEACFENPEYNEIQNEKLLKVQKLICTHLHQVFIADPNLAKLVHFQGYDSSLLNLVVTKIPSMHICLDFIPELLSQPDLNKQIFSIQLCSHLCKQYSITKSLSIAKLCFNVCNTLLPVLPSEKIQKFFIPVLPALVRMCEPFPPLYEDAISLLIQLSQISLSRLAVKNPTYISPTHNLSNYNCLIDQLDWQQAKKFFSSLPKNDKLSSVIQECFLNLLSIVKDIVN